MKVILFVSILMLITSCSNVDSQGYTNLAYNVKMKRHTIGSGDYYPRARDFVIIQTAFPKTRSVPEDILEQWQGLKKLQLTYNVKKGGLEYAITQLAEGDSASFLIPVASFYSNKTSSDFIQADVKLIEIYSPEDYQSTMRELAAWEAGLSGNEREELKVYLDKNYPGLLPESEGYYKIQLKEGSGPKAGGAERVLVHYTGYFLDGNEFDNTRTGSGPVEFSLKAEGQMIEGIASAVSNMRLGEKVRIIVPSHLAFGETGSSTGIVPPDASLIFEIELIKIE